jgi:hypothetical protein
VERPLLAQGGHRDRAELCPLLGVKRTSPLPPHGTVLQMRHDVEAALISQLEIRVTVAPGSKRANGVINERAFPRARALALTNAATSPARAGGGDVAAGLVGGLAAGTIIGAAVAGPRYYAPPPAVYVAPGPACYWTRGQPVWDGYRGVGCTRAFRFASRWFPETIAKSLKWTQDNATAWFVDPSTWRNRCECLNRLVGKFLQSTGRTAAGHVPLSTHRAVPGGLRRGRIVQRGRI